MLIPILAKGLDLVANAAMAKGKNWVKEKTGVDLDQPQLTSEDFVKLQNYQMEHEEELIKLKQEDNKLDAELAKAYLEDLQSAREMQGKALTQEDKFSKRFLYYFAMAWSIFGATYIAFITFGTIPSDNVRFADTVLGFLLGTLIAQIFNFFFGSSKGSQNKDAMIEQVVTRVTKK